MGSTMATLDLSIQGNRQSVLDWLQVLGLHRNFSYWTGNTGQALNEDTDPTKVNTYLTRDAGRTWTAIRAGKIQVSLDLISQQAAICTNSQTTALSYWWLTMWSQQTQSCKKYWTLCWSSSFSYTWDQGLSFTECKFTENGKVDISNIIVEPNYKAEEFLVHGIRQGGRGSWVVIANIDSQIFCSGLVVHFDFSPAQPRACEASDYETFTPGDHAGSKCLMGESVSYKRRKRDAACYNPNDFDPKTDPVRCACERSDYEW